MSYRVQKWDIIQRPCEEPFSYSSLSSWKARTLVTYLREEEPFSSSSTIVHSSGALPFGLLFLQLREAGHRYTTLHEGLSSFLAS